MGKEVEAEGEKLQQIGISQKTDFVAKERPGTTFELKDMSGSGQALFDTNAGRLVSKILEESFTMVVTVQGMRTEQRSKTKVTTTFGPATATSAEKPAPATEEKKPAAQ